MKKFCGTVFCLGWVLWLGLGDSKVMHSWLIVDAFETFIACKNVLGDQIAVFASDYPSTKYEIKLSQRNAVNRFEARYIRSDEEREKEKERIRKAFTNLRQPVDEEALDRTTRLGDPVKYEAMCLPGGTDPRLTRAQ
jgi:FMN phosphatase YigB (HAD superfamily)